MDNLERLWREKIADEVESAWKSLLLKRYYTSDLAASMIIDFIRKGDGETLR
jgi:hypothetical protein